MPPPSRNQRVPRAGAIPMPTAASSLERPAAISTQKWRRSSRRAAEGRPGDRNAPRPDRSERRLRVFTVTSFVEVLRRPLESALIAVIEMSQSSWLIAELLPRIERHPVTKLEPDEAALLRWHDDALQLGHPDRAHDGRLRSRPRWLLVGALIASPRVCGVREPWSTLRSTVRPTAAMRSLQSGIFSDAWSKVW